MTSLGDSEREPDSHMAMHRGSALLLVLLMAWCPQLVLAQDTSEVPPELPAPQTADASSPQSPEAAELHKEDSSRTPRDRGYDAGKIIGYTTLGVGVTAGVFTGVLMGVLCWGDECGEFALVSGLLGGAAGAAAGALIGTIIYGFLELGRDPNPESREVALMLAPNPDGVQLSLGGTF